MAGVTYTRCGHEIKELAQKLIEKNHPDLQSVEVRIAYLFALAARDKFGFPKGPALKFGNYPAAAIVRVVPLKQRADGRADAEICIDEDGWKDLSDDSKNALLDHELHHLIVMRKKKTGEIASDDLGRPKLRCRQHDFQLGGFEVIAARWKDAALEVQAAQAMADKYGQYLFPWANSKEKKKDKAA